jgi:hypothetical protein
MRKAIVVGISLLFFIGIVSQVSARHTHCWDLDDDKECDIETEDMNADGKCNVHDCKTEEQCYAVPQTGQTTIYATGDDGDLQKGVAWPNPRFTDNLDGTVTDNLTGLMWIKDASRGCFDTMAWQDALDGIADFNANPGLFSCNDYTANYNDWRLPNLNELKSLVHYDCDMPSISNTAGTACWDGEPFFGVRADHYWSGTTCTWSPGAAWTVNFTHGQGIPYDKTYTDRASVWPVRDGD